MNSFLSKRKHKKVRVRKPECIINQPKDLLINQPKDQFQQPKDQEIDLPKDLFQQPKPPNEESSLSSDLSIDDEESNDNEDICYICKDGISAQKPDLISSPCACKGSIGKIHRLCLIDSRKSQKLRHQNDLVCPICKEEYKIKKLSKIDRFLISFKEISVTVSIILGLEISCYLGPLLLCKLLDLIITDNYFEVFFQIYHAIEICLIGALVANLKKPFNDLNNLYESIEKEEKKPSLLKTVGFFCKRFYGLRFFARLILFIASISIYTIFSLVQVITENKVFATLASLGIVLFTSLAIINGLYYLDYQYLKFKKNHKIEDDLYLQ